MEKHNICAKNLGASKELASIAWERPDGRIVDLCEIDLIDEKEDDEYIRFFVHIDHETQELIETNPYLVSDINEKNDGPLPESVVSEEERMILFNWAKEFLKKIEVEEEE